MRRATRHVSRGLHGAPCSLLGSAAAMITRPNRCAGMPPWTAVASRGPTVSLDYDLKQAGSRAAGVTRWLVASWVN
jgi:hypothetical protein